MEKVNIEMTKDNALSLLGLLSIMEIDYKKSENGELLKVIEELKNDIREGARISESK